MEIKKVILIVQNKFTTRDYKRFGVEELLDAEFNIEVFDFSPILRNSEYNCSYLPQDEIFEDYITKIKSLEEFNRKLAEQNLGEVFISCFINLYPNTKKIFEIISFHKIEYAIFRNNCLPDIFPWYRILLSRIIYYLRYHILSPKISPASVAFVAGRKAKNNLGNKVSNKTKFINVASNDYNIFRQIGKIEYDSNKYNYPEIVFIDEYYPLHPDIEYEDFISPENYYKLVNNFLQRISNKMNMSCGIAVHPRADYSKKNPYNFNLFYNSTPELISKCKIVIGHASTSFSFVLLANKPLIQIGFQQTRNTIYGIGLEVFSKLIGLQKCYIDSEYDIPIPEINHEKYSEYIANYLVDLKNVSFYNANEALVSFLFSHYGKYNYNN